MEIEGRRTKKKDEEGGGRSEPPNSLSYWLLRGWRIVDYFCWAGLISMINRRPLADGAPFSVKQMRAVAAVGTK